MGLGGAILSAATRTVESGPMQRSTWGRELEENTESKKVDNALIRRAWGSLTAHSNFKVAGQAGPDYRHNPPQCVPHAGRGLLPLACTRDARKWDANRHGCPNRCVLAACRAGPHAMGCRIAPNHISDGSNRLGSVIGRPIADTELHHSLFNS